MTSQVMDLLPVVQFDGGMTHTLAPDRSSSTTASSADRLRLVLRANAATSALGGLVMAVAPEQLDELLGSGHPGWVRVIGLALLPFAALVAWLSTTDAARLRRLTPAIVFGDAGWVIASVATILIGWYSVTGVIVVLVMAGAVGDFAVLQWRFLRRLQR
jgi:hypothetical protein